MYILNLVSCIYIGWMFSFLSKCIDEEFRRPSLADLEEDCETSEDVDLEEVDLEIKNIESEFEFLEPIQKEKQD